MSHFITKLNRLRMEKKLCDVVLIIGQEKYHCHRIILASVSDYFEIMFKSPNFIEHNLNEIPLVDFDKISFQIFLDWAYTGNAIVTPNNVTDVLIMARRLLCEVLVESLESYVIGNSSFFNAVEYYVFSVNNEFPKLTKFYAEYLEINFWGIVQNRTYLKLPFEIFKNCSVSVNMDEKSKFEMITDWVEYDMTTRSNYFGDLIKWITFKELSPYLVLNWFSNHEVVMKPVFLDRVDEEPGMCIVARIAEDTIIKVLSCDDSVNYFKILLDDLCGLNYETLNTTFMRIAALNKQIYVFCGNTVSNCIFRHVNPYSESLITWRNVNFPREICASSMASINRANKIFISALLPKLYFYNADLDVWSHVAQEMGNNDICRQTLAANDNALYLCGGMSCNKWSVFKSVISLYDHRVPKIHDIGFLAIPTVHSAACVSKNSIYITGGHVDHLNDNGSCTVQRYDIIAGKTEIVQSMIHAKFGHYSFV